MIQDLLHPLEISSRAKRQKHDDEFVCPVSFVFQLTVIPVPSPTELNTRCQI